VAHLPARQVIDSEKICREFELWTYPYWPSLLRAHTRSLYTRPLSGGERFSTRMSRMASVIQPRGYGDFQVLFAAGGSGTEAHVALDQDNGCLGQCWDHSNWYKAATCFDGLH